MTDNLPNAGIKSKVKSLLLPSGRSPRVIRGGLLRGALMQLDFARHTQRWLGLQERELCRWFVRFARNIKTAIDVGTNDGFYTLYFLARTSAERVYSFEPSPECLRELDENLRLNNMPGEKRLEIFPQPVGATATNGYATLDSLRPRIVSPCLIKVDIDGGEGALLQGATECLSMTGIRWIVEVHSAALKDECMSVLKSRGYKVVIVENAWWRRALPELRPIELNHWLVAYRE